MSLVGLRLARRIPPHCWLRSFQTSASRLCVPPPPTSSSPNPNSGQVSSSNHTSDKAPSPPTLSKTPTESSSTAESVKPVVAAVPLDHIEPKATTETVPIPETIVPKDSTIEHLISAEKVKETDSDLSKTVATNEIKDVLNAADEKAKSSKPERANTEVIFDEATKPAKTAQSEAVAKTNVVQEISSEADKLPNPVKIDSNVVTEQLISTDTVITEKVSDRVEAGIFPTAETVVSAQKVSPPETETSDTVVETAQTNVAEVVAETVPADAARAPIPLAPAETVVADRVAETVAADRGKALEPVSPAETVVAETVAETVVADAAKAPEPVASAETVVAEAVAETMAADAAKAPEPVDPAGTVVAEAVAETVAADAANAPEPVASAETVLFA